jgi:hypothetical protein
MANPNATEGWGDPNIVAEVIYEVVGSGKKIPLRLPLGSDAWGMIKMEREAFSKELDELKSISEKPSGKEQLSSIDFLMK